MVSYWIYFFLISLYYCFSVKVESYDFDDWKHFRRKSSLFDPRYPEKKLKSVSFSSKSRNFTCASVKCERNILSVNSYAHFMVGAEHSSSFSLLVNRICEIYQKCIRPESIFILLHDSLGKTEQYYEMVNFLQSLGVPYKPINGSFTSAYKMIEYMKIFRNFSEWGPKDYIYHTGYFIEFISVNIYRYF